MTTMPGAGVRPHRWRCSGVFAGIAGILFFVRPGMAAPEPLKPFDLWYGVYFGANKMGFSSIQGRRVTVNGSPAFRVESLMSSRINLLGHEVSQEVDQIEVARPGGAPVSTSLVSRSAGHTSRVTATYTPRFVHCVIDNGDGLRTRNVPIPAGIKLGSSDDYAITPANLKPGASWADWFFDPATLAVEKSSGTVTGEAPAAEKNGQKLWVVQTQTTLGSMKVLVDREGVIIRTEMPLGIAIVKETREQARAAADYHPTSDLAEAGAVVPDGSIAHPRDATELHVTLRGVPPELKIPTGDGQEAVSTTRGEWKVAVSATPRPQSGPLLPEKAPVEDLQDTPELNASNPEMESTARCILGSEQNSLTAVTLLHDWVNVHMRARYDIGVLRSGLDVLHQPEGVCRDYAMLYTSLARAAGIPTRICAGLVCWKGKFYYHAWAESFVGRWIRVDATMPGETVDATHIALARGDARSMFRAAGVFGNLKMHVVTVK